MHLKPFYSPVALNAMSDRQEAIMLLPWHERHKVWLIKTRGDARRMMKPGVVDRVPLSPDRRFCSGFGTISRMTRSSHLAQRWPEHDL